MDHETMVKRNVLERMLCDESAKPTDLPLSLLKHITKDFSEDRKIGQGGFSVVYKGVLGNKTIAVKKLNEMPYILEKKFNEEVGCLMNTKHKNLVRFLGYCSDTQGIIVDHEGKFVTADVRQRLLCFEYIPRGGLNKYITGESRILEWGNLYEIIKEICEGLHYLHVKRHIVHLDLKPANILLDDNMVPKIADFGLSRCFCENQSRDFTKNLSGTFGYMAPESFRGEITFSTDIYSLGVIIREIITGENGNHDVEEMVDIWREKLQQPHKDIQLEQIEECARVAIECTDYIPKKRPDIQSIIVRLDKWSVDASVSRSSVRQSWSVPDNSERTGTTSNSTILVLYGKSSQEQDLLASAATSLSLDDSELSISLAPNVRGDNKGFDTGAYMALLSARRFGMWMLWSPRISSTQDLVADNFDKLPEGAVCIADTQFKGRGQKENVWISPPGCLMFSFTLRMSDARKLPLLQYVVCVAMVKSIKELCSTKGLPELDVKIKWPNDIYLKGLKVCGILCTSSYCYKVFNVSIGIGLNIDNEKPTTCLNSELQELKVNSPRLKREDMLASFFNNFEFLFDIYLYLGFHAFAERYYDSWLHSGETILVQDGHEDQSVAAKVTIKGVSKSGYLYGIGEDDKMYELHPDGNSFDFFRGLVRRKMEA